MRLGWTALILVGFWTASLPAAPVDAPGWFAQGNAFYAAKDYDNALAAYAQGLRMDNRSATAYEDVGSCFVGKGDIPNALKYYGWSLQLNPNNAPLRDYMARLQAGSAGQAPTLAEANRLYHQGDYGQAAALYQKLTELNPSDARAFQGLGNAYYAEGRQADAMAEYHQSLALNPGNQGLADFVAAHERAATVAASGQPADWFQPAWRSAIVPGWGQFYNQEPTKGLILGGLTWGCLIGVVATYAEGEQAMNQYEDYTGKNQSGYDTPYNTWSTMANWNHALYIGFGVLYTYTLIDAIVGAKPSPAVTALLSPDAPVALMADSKGLGFKARVLSF